MQIINGYGDANGFSRMLEFRLYHINRPKCLQHKKALKTGAFELDYVDQFVLDHCKDKKLVAVDCAGWYFEHHGFDVQVVEGSDISKMYHDNCTVEYDLNSHKPFYIKQYPILFRCPWFLKYASVDDLVNFLNLWVDQDMILNFHGRLIQHNYLKYDLIDIVRDRVDMSITWIAPELWLIQK